MANKKTKNSNEYVWALLAPRVNHLFGVFPSLDAAYNAACKLAEPDQTLKNTKQQMPLHYRDYRDVKGKEYYELWDESDGDWYHDPALFNITKLNTGKVYDDYKHEVVVEEEED